MAKINIRADQLEETVGKILDEYKGSISTRVKSAVDAAAKEAVAELKETSPRREDSKGYYKSWHKRVTKESADGKEITVYSTQPGLPHLLEYGHALRNGGRARAFVHIAPVEEKVSDQLEKDIIRSIENE